ncbi:formin-like protein 18 [Gastrolobium bilobum]|uniref:formin-like protein 18 n=1 Tax=Gastrolobium bilobum TaxID=150636 RepID=UPI002AAF6278|nr:formin-like protein 18 [Gastrolobium bilobum]
MATMRKLSFCKPPDGLLEISDRVYVFDCCFGMEHDRNEQHYKVYVDGVVGQFRKNVPDASILACNFGEEETNSKMANVLSLHDVTLMDYPRHYLGCPVLKMETMCLFLRSCESWLSNRHHNVLLMHCERDGWPVLAFMLAALLILMKKCDGEQRTLDMVYKQAKRELLHLLMPVNPIHSQLRYLQYVSGRNRTLDWPPLDRAIRLDCIIVRFIPNFVGEGGCGPVFRIYGQDPFHADKNPKILYSTPKITKNVRAYNMGDCETIKVDINCHIQGDVLIESINLNGDMDREHLMFRAMFNTAFIRSNSLVLNRDNIDVLWYAKDCFPKDFRAEILFSEKDAAAAVLENGTSCFGENEGLPVEAFSKIQEIFSYADWMNPTEDPALKVLQQRRDSSIIHDKLNTSSDKYVESGTLLHGKGPEQPQEKKNEANCFLSSTKQSPDNDMSRKEDKIIKTGYIPPQYRKSDILSQKTPSSLERTSDSSNCVTDSANPYRKQHSYNFALSGSVDTSSSGSMSPQTPPQHSPLSSRAKKVHDFPPYKESDLNSLLPLKSRHPLTEETESQSQDKCQSFNISSTNRTPSSCACQNKSPNDDVSDPPASAIRSTQSPLPSPQLSSPTPPLKKILPVRTRPDSFPSKLQTPPPPPTPPLKEHVQIRAGPQSPPTPPKDEKQIRAGTPPSPPTPPPPPCLSGKSASPTIAPPPPPPPAVPSAPAAPPPPTYFDKGGVKPDNGFPTSLLVGGDGHNVSGTQGHRSTSSTGSKGRIISHTSSNSQTKKLKPLHWLKLSRAVQGSLWAEAQKSGEASKAPEIDMSELESLFSAAVPRAVPSKKSNVQSSVGPKSDKVQLIDHTRAYNCEILLSKVKVPLHEFMSSVLALEESALDTDQVENLMKFCPTKEEIEVLKGYNGDKEKLGRCEQFFLELMKIPRVESKLMVFSFKIQFHSQASDLRDSLHVVNAASEEIRNSVKLRRIMQTILSLGNALNQGTAKGSAIGFRLDTLLKLTETRARNNKITLMHYLCKVVADKLPEVLDFSKDLANLEPAAKVQLKFVAEEMQGINKGLEKVEHELSNSENDGPISETFSKNLKEYLCSAKAEVSSLASLYSLVGRNVDALIIYFGEDPSRCPFEQVVTTLLNFTGMFNKAHEENCNQLELEMKKTEESEKQKCDSVSVKGLCILLSGLVQNGWDDGSEDWCWRKIWKWPGTLRMKILLWKLAYGRLPNKLWITSWSNGDSLCPICRSEDESIIHVFLDCAVVCELWCESIPLIHQDGFFTVWCWRNNVVHLQLMAPSLPHSAGVIKRTLAYVLGSFSPSISHPVAYLLTKRATIAISATKAQFRREDGRNLSPR